MAPSQIERILGGVLAKIALARGGHETGHAVVLRLGIEHAGGGFRRHPLLHQGLQPAGLLIQEANLHHVEMEQVLGVVENVRLEQLDPLLDGHVGQFFRRQVGQLHAGLVDGGQFLLLQAFHW